MKFTAKCHGKKDICFQKKSIRSAKMHTHRLFPSTEIWAKSLLTEDGQTFIFGNGEWFEETQEGRAELFKSMI